MAFVKYTEIGDAVFDEKNYLATGITELDKAIVGLGLGQLIIITGTRAGGKTTLIGNLICNFINNGFSGLLCSFEMTNKRLRQWLNLQALGKDRLKSEISLSGKEFFTPKDEYDVKAVDEWIGEKLEIYDNMSFDIDRVKKDIHERLTARPDIKFVILDNLMKLDTDAKFDSKWEMQSRFVKDLQIYAQANNLCLILVAHPNKIKALPRIEDVGGSGDIINAADTVLLVHRVTTDFKIRAKEYFDWNDSEIAFQYSNLIEIAKDREWGDDGSMIGVYFEPSAKRFLNYQNENKQYKWYKHYEQSHSLEEIDIEDGDLPF